MVLTLEWKWLHILDEMEFKMLRKSIMRVLCLLIIFCMSQVLPIMNFYRPLEINFTTTVVENTTLQEQIYSTMPACVFIEVESGPDEWYSDYHSSEWSGSGVIISEDGVIVTAGHVISEAVSITVRLNDGREFEAVDWYKEDFTDLGVIKIDSNSLLTAPISDSDSEFLGNQVFIIGCPFGEELSNTVTTGIVSGLKRDLDGLFGDKLLLQVDSQSWPGNSGGGVFNLRGEVIGILVGGRWGMDGISLCVPSKIVTLMLDKYYAEQTMTEAR